MPQVLLVLHLRPERVRDAHAAHFQFEVLAFLVQLLLQTATQRRAEIQVHALVRVQLHYNTVLRRHAQTDQLYVAALKQLRHQFFYVFLVCHIPPFNARRKPVGLLL